MLHKNSAVGDQHIPHQWEYADAAARIAATGFVSADLKKLAFQVDTSSFWVLTATTPTWIQVGTGASTSASSVSNTPAGNIAATDVQAAINELDSEKEPANANIQSHISSTSNPHSVTKAQVGLGNCDNTSDVNKPVSTAQAAADSAVLSSAAGDATTKANAAQAAAIAASTPVAHASDTANPHAVTYAQVGAAPALGVDDNYVTDAEKSVIGNTSGTNSGDAAINATYDADADGVVDAASSIVIDVRNATGGLLLKGTPVYISGATGQIATISVADAATEVASSKTLGLLASDLANNTNGLAIRSGHITALDTSAFIDGDAIWLAVGGGFTATRPTAPNHAVFLGFIAYSHAVNGKMAVSILNGYELQELHNVLITAVADKNTLQYESASGLWKNVSEREAVSNKVTSLSGASTDVQYPSAKLVFDQLALKAPLASPAFTGLASFAGGGAIASGQKIYLDGIAGTGDTYILESSANVLDFYVGGINAFRFGSSTATITGSEIVTGGLTAGSGSVLGYSRHHITNTFTSNGASTVAVGMFIDGTVTAAAGDTSYITGINLVPTSTVTQNSAETIAVVSSMRIVEPAITVGTDTITLASTLHITGAPTEGATNAALSVASGNTLLGGNVRIGSIVTAPTVACDVTGAIAASTTIKTGGYLVSTLPAGTAGERAYVTDATAPTYLGTLTGGGAVVCPVFKNATAWVSA